MKQCTPEQIQAANPYILAQAAYSRHSNLAFEIAKKKIDVTHKASDLIRSLKFHNNEWMLKHLYDYGMELYPKNVPAMQACISVGSVEMGQILIDRGMNFEHFEQFVTDNPQICEINETFTALKQYWSAKNPPEKPKTLADKMQAAGEKVKAQDEQSGNNKSRKREERE